MKKDEARGEIGPTNSKVGDKVYAWRLMMGRKGGKGHNRALQCNIRTRERSIYKFMCQLQILSCGRSCC
jgi:hypothetical protein